MKRIGTSDGVLFCSASVTRCFLPVAAVRIQTICTKESGESICLESKASGMDEQLEIALKGGDFKHLMERRFSSIKKEYNLRKVDIEVLHYLSRYTDENTPTDIHRRLKLNRGHVSQAIDRLYRRELIIAVPDEDDRRYMHYLVSDSAEEIIAEITRIKNELDQQIFEGIPLEEIAAYQKTTAKIFRNIQELI